MKTVALALTLFLPTLAFAQLNATVEPLTLSISPEYPKPNQTAIVRAESTVLDLPNSTMSVSVNGTNVYSGDVQATPITLASPGKPTTIKISLNSGGKIYTKSLIVNPGEVSLVQEPLSSAPALYKGKPLVPDSGSVRIVAVADLRNSSASRIDPATLSYTWTADGTTLEASSGVGRSSLTIPAPMTYRNSEISVVVQSRNGSVVGGDSLVLVSRMPAVRIYEDDPLMGILFDHALVGSRSIAGAEITLFAQPYSFSLSRGKPLVNWLLSGSPAQNGAEITLRPQGSGKGTAELSAQVSNTITAENVSASLTLSFGNSGSSFFGL